MRISDWSSDVCSSDLCKGSAIDIGAKNLLRRSIVICVIYGVSRPHHLRIEPGCLTDPGEVGRLTVLKHEIRNVEREIARASCRERVCQRVDLGGSRSLKNKTEPHTV